MNLPLGAFIGHMSGADFFGLVVSVLVCAVPAVRAVARGEVLAMTFLGWLTIFGFAAILTALALPLGRYMAAVYTGERTWLDRVFGVPERLLYRVMRVDPNKGQDWKAYAKSVIIFSLAGWLLLYFILRTQTLWNWTGLNPQGFHSAPWNVTFNTTSSFVTNTNWQYYSGETTMSYFSQMVGLTVQNFVSAAVGISVAVALIRGIIGAVGQEPRQFLAGPGPHDACTCCCRSRLWSRWCWCSRARSRISVITCSRIR